MELKKTNIIVHNVNDFKNYVDYVGKLEQQCKKQKEVIDKIKEYIQKIFYFNEETGEYSLLHTIDKDNIKELLDILKGEQNER